jgi:SAM-dependent methyltransferase
MDKNYWDTFSTTYNAEIFDVLKNDKNGIIKSCINQQASPKKVVGDIGCAIGKWLPLLSSKFKQVYAIDFSTAFLDYSKKKYKQLKNIVYQDTDMTVHFEPENKFDTILCVNAVITDNYSRRNSFFKNLFSSLTSNGSLILVVPSLESALYSEFVFDEYQRKMGLPDRNSNSLYQKSKSGSIKKGIIDIDNIPTKHYLKEELVFTLAKNGFTTERIDKVEYSWNTEMADSPKWLRSPYPWDWLALAHKKAS